MNFEQVRIHCTLGGHFQSFIEAFFFLSYVVNKWPALLSARNETGPGKISEQVSFRKKQKWKSANKKVLKFVKLLRG